MNKVTDPTPAPPLEGRGVATAGKTNRMALPSLVGEGQGWGHYISLPSLQGERLRERQRVGASAGMGERSSGMGQGWGL